MRNILLAAIAAITLTGPAKADSDAYSRYQGCAAAAGHNLANDMAYAIGYCMGFIAGEFNGLEWGNGVCTDGNAKTGQLVLIVVSYMQKHPAELNQDFAMVTLHALQQAFPCGRR
jgi:hypothetical protein